MQLGVVLLLPHFGNLFVDLGACALGRLELVLQAHYLRLNLMNLFVKLTIKVSHEVLSLYRPIVDKLLDPNVPALKLEVIDDLLYGSFVL